MQRREVLWECATSSSAPAASQWRRRRALLLGHAAPWAWEQMLPHVCCHFSTAVPTDGPSKCGDDYIRRTQSCPSLPTRWRAIVFFFAHRTNRFDVRRRAPEQPLSPTHTVPDVAIRWIHISQCSPLPPFPMTCPVARAGARLLSQQRKRRHRLQGSQDRRALRLARRRRKAEA